jgi:hypothetical protein
MDYAVTVLHMKMNAKNAALIPVIVYFVLNNSMLMLNCRTNRQRRLGRPWMRLVDEAETCLLTFWHRSFTFNSNKSPT